MKRFSLALAVVAGSALLVTDAVGQSLRQPTSFRPVAYDYDYFAQDDAAPSPSDQVIAPEENGAAAAPSTGSCAAAAAPSCGCAAAGGCSVAGGCNGTCGCDSGCDSGCGIGDGCGPLGLGLGRRFGSGPLACCELGEPWRLSGQINCDPLVTVGGWMAAGYYNRNNGLFNSHPGKFHMTQSLLYLEKEAERCDCSWDWGFRVDGMYGTDAQDTQAFGNSGAPNPQGWDNDWDNGIYGWALPQMYLEMARGDLSIKFGKFYTMIGYEVIPAPGNFFFSHAITMYNSEPFTHTGILAEYAYSDDVTLFGGWTLGWDTGFDQFRDGGNFLGGISTVLSDDVTLTYATTIGDFGARGDDGYMSSLVLDVALTDRLQYVAQNDLLWVDPVGGGQEDVYGLNQYLIYNYSDCLAFGARYEWWKGDPLTNYTPFGSVLPGANGNHSYYEATHGINYKPHANVNIRPEIRYDWSPALNYDVWTFGIDAYVTF